MSSDFDLLLAAAAERDAHELAEHGLRLTKPIDPRNLPDGVRRHGRVRTRGGVPRPKKPLLTKAERSEIARAAGVKAWARRQKVRAELGL